MGWFEDLGNAVADGFEAVGDAVESAVNAVAEAVTDVVETAGNALQDGYNALGGWLSGIPIIGGALQGFCTWLGGVVAGIFNVYGAIIKGVLGIVGGMIGGTIKVIGGILTLHGGLIVEGFIDMGSSIAGAVIAVGGTLISVGQRLIPFINQDRALTKDEYATLHQVFRGSLALYNIRIKSNNGVGGTYTLDNTIYTNIPDLAIPMYILVHECVHVWQYQNRGTRYLAEALGAQAVYGRDPNGRCISGDAYDWIGELNRGNTNWEDFNMEAAAELIEEIWTDGSIVINEVGTTNRITETGNGAFYKKPLDPEDLHFSLTETFVASTSGANHCPRDGADHTDLAISAVKSLRGRWNFRLSQFFA